MMRSRCRTITRGATGLLDPVDRRTRQRWFEATVTVTCHSERRAALGAPLVWQLGELGDLSVAAPEQGVTRAFLGSAEQCRSARRLAMNQLYGGHQK